MGDLLQILQVYNCRCVQLSAKAERIEIMFIYRSRYRGE